LLLHSHAMLAPTHEWPAFYITSQLPNAHPPVQYDFRMHGFAQSSAFLPSNRHPICMAGCCVIAVGGKKGAIPGRGLGSNLHMHVYAPSRDIDKTDGSTTTKTRFLTIKRPIYQLLEAGGKSMNNMLVCQKSRIHTCASTRIPDFQ